MEKYLVGQGENVWEFTKAVNAAVDGDTIEFQEGYCPTVGNIIINKSLTFIGKVNSSENGNQNYTNVIYGMIFIKKGAKVVFQNLWLRCGDEKNNIINCKEKSTVELIDVVIENTQTEGDVYPIIWMEDQSHIHMKGVIIKKNEKFRMKANVCGSIVEVDKCNFNECRIVLSDSRLTMSETYISYSESNVIHAKKSTLELISSTLEGADTEKDYPAIYCENCKLSTKSCLLKQPQYIAGLLLKENTTYQSEDDDLESVKIVDGRARFCNTSIRVILHVEKGSYAYIGGQVDLLGENDTKVDLLVAEESVVQGEKICVNRVAYPNFRVMENSVVRIKELQYTQGNLSDLELEGDETSDLSYQPQTNATDAKTETQQSSAREQLDQLIGLKSVKREIEKMLRMVEFNQQRIAQGLEPQEQSFHSVFLGNPGTGKTTVARLIGEVLYESGAFKSEEFKLIEASEPDFISQNVGGTAQQTLELLEKAKGGVLFIDEAYALNKKGANVDFGIEAINTILKYMEDHRGEIMIIFAGYTKEMEQFLKTNPGLMSRVPNRFVFEDYTPDEIVEIGEKDLIRKQYKFENEEYYAQQVKRAYRNSLDHSNARWIRNFNEKLLKAFANRVMNTGENDLVTIKKEDLDEVLAQGKYQGMEKEGENALERLEKLIGIGGVKEQVQRFISLVELNQRREEQGQINNDFTLHSLFLGNPGTGKTTVARIVGDVLYQKGIISQKKFIEVSRSDLVAGYIGQTAIKTKEVLESALGGVLFIDEAYTLSQGGENDFGIEAINEILKFMEDHRKDMVIIFAGYTKEMGEFLSKNSGLASRVPHTFDFEDYTPDEIVQIGLLGLHNAGYQVDETSYSEVVKQNYSRSDDHSNGRWVRNLNEELIMVMSNRVSKSENVDLNLIMQEDLDLIAIEPVN